MARLFEVERTLYIFPLHILFFILILLNVKYVYIVKICLSFFSILVSKFGNSLIPRKFGKFPDRFLVNVLEHSFDACAQIENALFSTLDKDYSDLYTQELHNFLKLNHI